MSSSFFMTQACNVINGINLAFEPAQASQHFHRFSRREGLTPSSQMQYEFVSRRITDGDGRPMRVNVYMTAHPVGFDEIEIRFTSGEGDTIKFSKCCDYESVMPSYIVAFVHHCIRDFHVDGHADAWKANREELKAATAK